MHVASLTCKYLTNQTRVSCGQIDYLLWHVDLIAVEKEKKRKDDAVRQLHIEKLDPIAVCRTPRHQIM